MRRLYHPPPGFTPRSALFFFLLLTPAFEVWNKPPQHNRFQCRFPGIPLVQTQMLGMFKAIRPFNDKRVQQRLKLRYIVPVRPGDDQRQGYSRSVYEHMAFAAVFSPGRSGYCLPLPEPKALCLCIRRRSAMTTGYLQLLRMRQDRLSIRLGKTPPRTRTGNTGVRRLKNPGILARRSTGYRYAAHRKSPQGPYEVPSAAVPRPVFADSPGGGLVFCGATRAQRLFKRHRLFPMNGFVSSFSLPFLLSEGFRFLFRHKS